MSHRTTQFWISVVIKVVLNCSMINTLTPMRDIELQLNANLIGVNVKHFQGGININSKCYH